MQFMICWFPCSSSGFRLAEYIFNEDPYSVAGIPEGRAETQYPVVGGLGLALEGLKITVGALTASSINEQLRVDHVLRVDPGLSLQFQMSGLSLNPVPMGERSF